MKRRDRHSFTLVEMLTVIAIIGILISTVMFVLFEAEQSGKEAKTRTMITAIHRIVMDKYDSYSSRKFPIAGFQGTGYTGETAAQYEQRKVDAEQSLMKMELPTRWTDITNPPDAGLERTALSKAYLDAHTALAPTVEHQQAECLYLIVKYLTRGHQQPFKLSGKGSDIGDTDGDGAREILDAWGRPIYFLRDAPAFPSPAVKAGEVNLWPLIYSGGPDRKFGVDVEAAFADLGRPIPADPNTYLDNVHNHLLFKKL